MTPAALNTLSDQPRVRDFLATAVAEGRLSHAYLFVGAPGSGKHEAAEALAKCVVCPNGGDATCDECRRVAHRTHPDVHWLAPESATGYLVTQVRELIADAALAPMRAPSKVYVLERAELLREMKRVEAPTRAEAERTLTRSGIPIAPSPQLLDYAADVAVRLMDAGFTRAAAPLARLVAVTERGDVLSMLANSLE